MFRLLCVLLMLFSGAALAQPADPLPSWKDSAARVAILEFVRRVTTPGEATFVPAPDRYVVFDIDGTLWPDYPVRPSARLAADLVASQANAHAEWYRRQPYRNLLEHKTPPEKLSEREILQIQWAAFAGQTEAATQADLSAWIQQYRHPRYNRPLEQLVYRPMQEVLDYLQANGFRVYLLAQGGVELPRLLARSTFGVAPAQIIGSQAVYDWRARDKTLVRSAQLRVIDDLRGKVGLVAEALGQRPLAVFGSGDGDLSLMQWVASGDGARLVLVLRHDDESREAAYEQAGLEGSRKLLEYAGQQNWPVVSIKEHWLTLWSEPLGASLP